MSGYQIGLDPAFMAAYQSPNYYQNQYVAPVDNTYVAQNVTPQPTLVENKTNTSTQAEKKSGVSTAEVIIGTVLTLGAAALCKKAYVKGNPNKGFFKRIGDGFNKFWESGSEKLTQYIKPERFSHTTVNGQNVYTIPNRRNIIRTNGAQNHLAEIGVSADAPQIHNAGKLAKGIKIRSGECTLAESGNSIVYKFKNGKLTSIKYNGEDIMKSTDPNKLNIKKQVEEKVKRHMKGEDLDNLNNLAYSHSENGTSRLFRCANGTENPQLTAGVSRNFSSNSDAIQAYAADNPKVKDVLKAIDEGKTDGLKIASAEYIEPSLGTFHIKDGKITGITQGNTFYDTTTDRFKNLYSNNKEAFDNVLKQDENKFTNVVRILA